MFVVNILGPSGEVTKTILAFDLLAAWAIAGDYKPFRFRIGTYRNLKALHQEWGLKLRLSDFN